MNTAVGWLERTRIELRAARKHWNATRARLAPDFNTIRFLRRDEHGLSIILADLFDPEGSHGQGSLFLQRFVGRYWPDKTSYCNGALIRLESPTNVLRRIDITIRFDDGAMLGVESKLCGASDQDQQVAHYLDHLRDKSRDGAHRLIYLTPQRGKQPGENSIAADAMEQAEKDGRLLCLCADDLTEWLNDCIGHCRAERVRAFLGDLIDYLKTDLQGIRNMNEHDLIVEAATKDAASVRDALQIAAAREAIRDSLLSHYWERLKQRTAAGDLPLPIGWEMKADMPLSIKGNGIDLLPKRFPTHRIRLQFDAGDARNAAIGIARKDGKDFAEEMTNVGELLLREFGNGHQEAGWPWWRKFDPENWGGNPNTMALILDESENGMVARTLRTFIEILDVLKKYDLFDKFSTTASVLEAAQPSHITPRPQE